MPTYYNFDEVHVLIGGVHVKEFSAEGTSVKIEMEQNQFTETIGTDGNVVVNKNLNAVGTIEISLMQTSESNPILSAILEAAYNGLFTTFPVAITDINGTSLYTGAQAWLRKYPVSNYGKEATARQWTIVVGKLINFIGDSSQV